jgi:hypothetical protein
LLDQQLGFRLGLAVAGQQHLASTGRRQTDIDCLDGDEFSQRATTRSEAAVPVPRQISTGWAETARTWVGHEVDEAV